mmetsp:Transcript_20822/g.52725  ORF Transcript_20822/g.52725 Transcript_20822/m.52725 type:complete len:243 (+) Transcript_20822:337-1065(+)
MILLEGTPIVRFSIAHQSLLLPRVERKRFHGGEGAERNTERANQSHSIHQRRAQFLVDHQPGERVWSQLVVGQVSVVAILPVLGQKHRPVKAQVLGVAVVTVGPQKVQHRVADARVIELTAGRETDVGSVLALRAKPPPVGEQLDGHQSHVGPQPFHHLRVEGAVAREVAAQQEDGVGRHALQQVVRIGSEQLTVVVCPEVILLMSERRPHHQYYEHCEGDPEPVVGGHTRRRRRRRQRGRT